MRRILLASLPALLLAAPRAEAVVIGIEPSALSVLPGETVLLDLVVSDLGGAVVGAFDLDAAFDPAALVFDGYTLGSFLGDPGLGEALDFSLGLVLPGTINLAVVSTLSILELQALQPSSFALATLAFTVQALDPGSSTEVEIAAVHAIGDGSGAPLPVDSLTGAALRRLPSTSVAEPSGLVLLGLALMGMVGVRPGRHR